MRKLKIMTLAIAASTSLSAFAATSTPFSAELMIGFADQESDFSGSSPSKGDDTSFGFRFGYKLNPNLAFELAYSDYGEAEDDYTAGGTPYTDTLESSAVQAGVKAILPLTPEFSLIGRLGVSSWDYDLEVTSPSFPGAAISDDDSGTDLYYGVGFQYDINAQWFSSLSYTLTKMDAEVFSVSTDHEVKDLTVSLGARF